MLYYKATAGCGVGMFVGVETRESDVHVSREPRSSLAESLTHRVTSPRGPSRVRSLLRRRVLVRACSCARGYTVRNSLCDCERI